MSESLENVGSITKVVPLEADGFVRVPQAVIDLSPLRICNQPPDEVFFASSSSVMRDKDTRILMIDTRDLVAPLPPTEVALHSSPALMRVFERVGGRDIDGFLVDYRRIFVPSWRNSDLSEGITNPTFEKQREDFLTVFPLGVIQNNAGVVEFQGPEELLPNAEALQRRVDKFVSWAWSNIAKFHYHIPLPEQIDRPARPEPQDSNAAGSERLPDVGEQLSSPEYPTD